MGDLINHLQKYNRSFPIGLSKLPGAGYILTGGVSPLSRAYGLAIDNIESIKGFLGNGTFISLKKNQINPEEQLIWEAIKGAAPFFSIITEIELKTIQSNPIKQILYISVWVIIWGTLGSFIDYPLYKNKIYLEGSIYQYLTFTITAIISIISAKFFYKKFDL